METLVNIPQCSEISTHVRIYGKEITYVYQTMKAWLLQNLVKLHNNGNWNVALSFLILPPSLLISQQQISTFCRLFCISSLLHEWKCNSCYCYCTLPLALLPAWYNPQCETVTMYLFHLYLLLFSLESFIGYKINDPPAIYNSKDLFFYCSQQAQKQANKGEKKAVGRVAAEWYNLLAW